MLRATKIGLYARIMQAQGIVPRRILAGTSIDEALIDRPDYLVSLSDYYRTVANMIDLSGDPALGISIGEMIRPADLGIVGYALMSSDTLRRALGIWVDYSNSLIGMSIKIRSTEDRMPGYRMTFVSQSVINAIHRFETEELLAGITMVPDLTGLSVVLENVSLSYPKPDYSHVYDRFFRCPIDYDAAHTAIVARAPHLDSPIRTRNDELYEMCRQHCSSVLQSLPGAPLLQSQLRSLFAASPANIPGLKEVAGKLGLSERSLRRKLDAEGSSFQGLKDAFRLDLSREYFFSGHFAIKEVSGLLGFATPSAFCRAFKAWTGKTVAGYFQSAPENACEPVPQEAIHSGHRGAGPLPLTPATTASAPPAATTASAS